MVSRNKAPRIWAATLREAMQKYQPDEREARTLYGKRRDICAVLVA